MSRHPGFRYDSVSQRAHFDCYVPGTSGEKRRRRTVQAPNRARALALWREFQEELAAEALGVAAEKPAPVPTLPTVSLEVAPRNGTTLNSFIEDHFATIAAGLRPSTIKSHTSIIEKRLTPVFGHMAMTAITSIVVQDFKVSLRNEGLAPSYINDCMRVLKMLLHQAVEREVIATYPLRKRVPREKEPVLRLEMSDAERLAFLGAFDDFERFAAHLDGKRKKGAVVTSVHFNGPRAFGGGLRAESEAARRYFERFRWLKPLFVVALETGLRKGDLLTLAWKAVDSTAGWIRLTMEKTGFEATIPISAACAKALEACRSRAIVSATVFVDENGRRLSVERLRRTFSLAKKLANITRRCRFHDLRHTFASRLVSHNVNLRIVASALGHTTTQQTERYAKPSESAMRTIAKALDAGALAE